MRAVVTTTFALVMLSGHWTRLPAKDFPELQRQFQAHCVKCHGSEDAIEADVNLAAIKSQNDLKSRPELLEDLIAALKDHRMPPADEPPLAGPERAHIVAQLKRMLDEALRAYPFVPTPIRRMNRFQYNNAVVDLLELDRDIFQLNERLLRRRDDYFHPETRKMPAEVRISSRPLSKDIDNQRPEGFKDVAAFPQDKRAEHGFDNRADHLTLSPLLMESFLQLSQSIVESPDLNSRECRSWPRLFAPPGQHGPVDGRYEAESKTLVHVVSNPKGRAEPQDMARYGDHWSGNAQLFWRCPEQGSILTVSFESHEASTGLRFGFSKAGDYGKFDVRLDDAKIGETIDLYSAHVVHAKQEVPGLKIEPGKHTLRFQCVGKNDRSTGYYFGLDFLDLTGRASRADPQAAPGVATDTIRLRLAGLLRRAFRQPVDLETLDRFAKFAEKQMAAGASMEDAMRTVVGTVLAMPDFLYFYEETSDGSAAEDAGRRPVNDFELASRLAQFLWSSIPDDRLLDLAEAGKLREPQTLAAEIDRMLNDRKSSRFCDNFPAQWLQLDRLITSIPDRDRFSYFYYHGYRTSMHMLSEPLLLFETVYIEDRSILDLLAPDFTWQSEMLRQNYEGQSKSHHDVQVQLFRRVPLKDPRRGGVITNAAVMTMTSTPTRTQPITRGAWLNEVIFNDPPKPPPADVPPLPEVDREKLAKLTIRERLAVHRQRADCAGCHDRIDPLGFALENFGPTGVWRDKYENGRDVDPSGKLFNQHEFKTLVKFKSLLLQERRRFIRAFVAHLLSYAMARELGPADSPALDEITARAMSGQDQMRSILKSVAMSAPFLHKSSPRKQDAAQHEH